MLAIAICEDDKMQQIEIEKYVRDLLLDESIEIDLFDSGEELVAAYERGKKYSIILLDMQMKKLDGIQTAKLIKKHDKYGIIIIVTSVIEYAVEGYSIDAYDFILKPVDESKLHRVLAKAIDEIQVTMNKSYLIKSREKIIAIRLLDVLYFESNKKKVILHTSNNEYENNENISNVEKRLCKDGFIRISRFYLVNVHHIKEIGIREVVISNYERLIYSDKYADVIKNKYLVYMMGEM